MAEDIALGRGERNRHVRRILVQVSTFRLSFETLKTAVRLWLFLFVFLYVSICVDKP